MCVGSGLDLMMHIRHGREQMRAGDILYAQTQYGFMQIVAEACVMVLVMN